MANRAALKGNRRTNFVATSEWLEPRLLMTATNPAALMAAAVRVDTDGIVGDISQTSGDIFGPVPMAAAAMEMDHDHMDDEIRASDPTAPFVYLQHDTIPNFVQNPTATTIRSGKWSDPAVWSTGRVPGNNDIVLVRSGNTIDYSTFSDTLIPAIGIAPGGTLRFDTKSNTCLTVGTLMVFEGGTLQIGAPTSPVASNVKAEVIFSGAKVNWSADPKQYGIGLLGFGKVDINGAAKSTTFTRLAREPRAGDTYLDLDTPVGGWRAGETLFLPDSRQVLPHMAEVLDSGATSVYPAEWEEVKVAAVVGSRIYLQAPLQFAHPGAVSDDGSISLLPHVAVLDRNVVFRSADPNGTRGHVLLGGRADINIRYARFEDLGRTSALVPVDNTVVDATGAVTHFGTNQIGRYAMHLHHLIGPENEKNTGYQFKLIGNTFDDGRRWGVALHSTSFGLLQDNVAYKFQGAGFATEDGSEIENLFTHNFIARIQGTNIETVDAAAPTDVGRSGTGFWMRKAGNILRNNVVTDVSFAGLAINGRFALQEHLPAFRGANDDIEGEYVVPDHNPAGWIDGLEVYGRTRNGVWITYGTGSSEFESDLTLRGLKIWHTHGNGIEMYHLNRVTLDDVTILGQKSAIGSARMSRSRLTIGMKFTTYEMNNLVVRRARIENQHIGIITPESAAGTADNPADPTRIENSYLRNVTNMRVSNAKYAADDQLRGKSLIVSDTMFLPINTAGMLYVPAALVNIEMWYREPKPTDSRDLMSLDRVMIYNYNRVPGDSFRLYYTQQDRNFVPPSSSYGITSPIPGLTNGQLWSLLGVALGGALAPVNATTRDGIIGLLGPVSGPAQSIAAPLASSIAPDKVLAAATSLAADRQRITAIDTALSTMLSAKASADD